MWLCSVASYLSNSTGSAGVGYDCFGRVASCGHSLRGGWCTSVGACLLVHCGQLHHVEAWAMHQHLQLFL